MAGTEGSKMKNSSTPNNLSAKPQDLENRDAVKRMVRCLYSVVPLREAVQLSKRVEYFRGRKMIDALLSDKTKISKRKDFPVVESEVEAIEIGVALLKHGFIHASRVRNKSKRELEPIPSVNFDAEGYYTWIYQGSNMKRNFLLGSLIFGVLSMVMFPVWPQPLKVGVWYLSVTLLLLLTVLIIIRLILYLLLWMFGLEFWIFPNLFDDDASILESFIPLYSSTKGENSKEAWLSRSVCMVFCALAAYWLYTQPTEFDEILVIQRQFVQDLYEGKLLSDQKQTSQVELDRAVPDLEELRRQLEEDELLSKNLDDEENQQEDLEVS